MKKHIGLIVLITGFAFSQTGLEIAQQIDEKEKPKDMKADLTMVLTNKKGKTRSSTIRSISKDDSKKQIIWFLAPADDKGVAFLKIEHEEKDDEMRLWLPAFNKVRRISSKQKADSFMGSDMSYEDMTSRKLDEYTYKLTGSEKIDGNEYYILESVPNPEIESTYSKHVAWISKLDYLIMKEESYDKSGRILKVKLIKYMRLKGYNIPEEMYVENVQKSHSTLLTFDKIELDTNVQDALFQEKNLKRLPR
ncbi:MAG: outer membrane lipoprotein-sorting protein [Planctomycetia bacterium]|nr:outer membrane lipoprotein-sorting protein [Planctomycetia bacterium]